VKAFRGTLIALLLLVLVAGIAFFARPALLTPKKKDPTADEIRLFNFEKQELVKVEVVRPPPEGDTLVLEEQDGKWIIEGTGFVAGRSMVNRIKHQIHDLTARATVIDNPDTPELYGLGKNAIHVTLTMRDGRTVAFLAGDPNPSGVSYYIQPLPGTQIYTVKKAALDYYSLGLSEFREHRFASFDSKDAVRISAKMNMPGAPRDLVLEKTAEDWWEMRQPLAMTANLDRVKRLMGRVSALKAQDFIEIEQADMAKYGLDRPRADITVEFASREPLHVLVGGDAPSPNKYEELAYVMIAGDSTVYVARRGLLEEFGQDPSELRNRKVVKLKEEDVKAIDAWLRAEEKGDPEGQASVRYAAEQWVWKDGVPVPGSTPSRVAQRLAELDVDTFIDDKPKALSEYGLDNPVARVSLQDAEGGEKAVLIGNTGEPEKDPDGNERERRYAAVEGDPSVYLVNQGVLEVVQDMVREYNRKKERDDDKARRQERIGSEPDPAAVQEAEDPK